MTAALRVTGEQTVKFGAGRAVVPSLAADLRGLNQAVAHQRPVDARAAGQRGGLLPGELVADGLRSPAGVVAADHTHPGLHWGWWNW